MMGNPIQMRAVEIIVDHGGCGTRGVISSSLVERFKRLPAANG